MAVSEGTLHRAEPRFLRLSTSLSAIALASLSLAGSNGSVRTHDPLFTGADRSKITEYWSQDGRLTVGPALSATTRGTWQVRLTPEGSLWLWDLSKGHKTAASLMPTPLPDTAPTATPVSTTPVTLPTSLLERTSPPIHQQAPVAPKPVPTVTLPIASAATVPAGNWDTWINKKVRHDRWQALRDARANNSPTSLPPADRDTPDTEPEQPGPCPSELAGSLGVPPPFARAVQPKSYKIQFDDATVQYEDNVRLSSPKYAYYRFSDGVMSGGVPLKKFDPDRLQKILQLAGCDTSQEHVMKAVSPLEGGFDSINTYDTGFVSVGFIQFASLKEGAGSLGSVLLNYKTADPEGFDTDFHRYGVDVQSNGVLDVMDPQSGDELVGADANAAIIRDKRLIAIFQRAGQLSDGFCAAQVKTAMAQYYPSQDPITFKNAEGVTCTCRVCDLVHCESGMAMLFDRKVNTGNISLLSRQASAVASAHRCQTAADLSKYEKDIVAGLKYREDFTKDPELTQPK